MREGSADREGSLNLVVCCDGTGNPWTRARSRTHVVKLVEALVHDPARQVFFYDPGVGTADEAMDEGGAGGAGPRARLSRLAGLAWGRGVWTNVGEAYRFLMQRHRPADRIYLLGFSRGAFTARAVAGMVHLFGILRPEHESLLPTLLSVYRAPAGAARNQRAQSLKARFATVAGDTRVEFIGVWDTVESVGLSSVLFGQKISSPPTLKSSFGHVRHALALDETRRPYAPRRYVEDPKRPLAPDQSLLEVWFAGAHADVGGGYEADGLANVSLHWMAREANAHGLLLDFDRLERHATNPEARLHDQPATMPLWALAGLARRPCDGSPPVVHASVKARAQAQAMRYAVPGLEAARLVATRPEVTDADGRTRPRPVPERLVPARPPAVRAGAAAWTLALLGLAGVVGFSLLAAPGAVEFAARQASWSRFFDLGAVLLAFERTSGHRVAGLLWLDLGLVASNALLICVLDLAVFRTAGRKVRSPTTWKVFMTAGSLFLVADLLENLASRVALWIAEGVSPCVWRWAVAFGAGASSLVAHLASWAKFGLLAVYVGSLVLLGLRGLFGRARA